MIKVCLRAAILAICAATPALSDGLTVSVEGLRNGNGTVLIFVFDNARAYNSLNVWKAADYAAIPARQGRVTHVFKRMKRGPYAVFLFHDENNDEDLNTEGDRLLEGVGASGAPNPEDNPDFAQASVWPGNTIVHIHYDQ